MTHEKVKLMLISHRLFCEKNQWMKECGRVLGYGNQVYEYRHNNSYDDD